MSLKKCAVTLSAAVLAFGLVACGDSGDSGSMAD